MAGLGQKETQLEETGHHFIFSFGTNSSLGKVVYLYLKAAKIVQFCVEPAIKCWCPFSGF